MESVAAVRTHLPLRHSNEDLPAREHWILLLMKPLRFKPYYILVLASGVDGLHNKRRLVSIVELSFLALDC